MQRKYAKGVLPLTIDHKTVKNIREITTRTHVADMVMPGTYKDESEII
jgi:hypothetical protein